MFPGAKGFYGQMKFWNTVITYIIWSFHGGCMQCTLLRHLAMAIWSYYPMLRACPFADLSSGAGMMIAVSACFIYSTEYALSCPSVYCWGNSWWSQSVVSCFPIVLHQNSGEHICILWHKYDTYHVTPLLMEAETVSKILNTNSTLTVYCLWRLHWIFIICHCTKFNISKVKSNDMFCMMTTYLFSVC